MPPQEMDLSEENLKALVTSAQDLMTQFDEKMKAFEFTNEDLEKYMNEIEASKTQTIGMMRVSADEYIQKLDEREEELKNTVDIELRTVRYEFQELQKQLEDLRSEFTTYIQDKEQLVDLKFLGTYESLQSEMNEQFNLMENAIKAISSQLNNSIEEFASLKNAMTTFVNK